VPTNGGAAGNTFAPHLHAGAAEVLPAVRRQGRVDRNEDRRSEGRYTVGAGDRTVTANVPDCETVAEQREVRLTTLPAVCRAGPCRLGEVGRRASVRHCLPVATASGYLRWPVRDTGLGQVVESVEVGGSVVAGAIQTDRSAKWVPPPRLAPLQTICGVTRRSCV